MLSLTGMSQDHTQRFYFSQQIWTQIGQAKIENCSYQNKNQEEIVTILEVINDPLLNKSQ